MPIKTIYCGLLVHILCFVTVIAVQNDNLGEVDLQNLLLRIEKLENNDYNQQNEISVLKETLKSMEVREQKLLTELSHLKQMVSKAPVNKVKNFRMRRDLVETEVAFYAVMSTYDIQHLGQNQDLPFDTAITNIGNAFSTRHGIFRAPVAGTYAFHVTLACESAHNKDAHFHAKIDYNGTEVASFIITPGDQSSQMVVLQLALGDEVSVKNNIVNDSMFGQMWSSFSGYILFENANPSTSVIG